MRGLKSDLEEEVLNNEKLKTALAVSKSLVDSLSSKYTEAMEQATKSAKTSAEHDKTSKALEKAEEEIDSIGGKRYGTREQCSQKLFGIDRNFSGINNGFPGYVNKRAAETEEIKLIIKSCWLLS